MMIQTQRRIDRSIKRGWVGLLFFFGLMAGGCAGVNVPDPAVRYIAFGDSTTSGPNDLNYWNFLAEKIGQPAEWFANEGNGGESSSEGLERLKGLIERELYPNAQVLLYWQGGDDLISFIKNRDPLLALFPNAENYPYTSQLEAELDRIQGNIEQSITLAQDAGLDVYVATYYLLKENKRCKPAVLEILLAPQAAIANQYLDRLNDRIRLSAQNTGAVLVDVEPISPTLLADPNNYTDCNHLSDQGNRQVADVFYAVLVPVTE